MGPEGDFALPGAHAVARIVELQPLRFHDVGGARRGGTPQHGLDARQQLARRERLGDVVVGAALEAADLVLLLGLAR